MSEAKIVISAQDNASRVLANVRNDLQGVGASAARLTPILAGLGVTLSAGATFAWAKGIVNGLDALNDLKDATGSSIENISALEDVAARTGTTFDTVGTSLVKFNTVLKDAKAGNDAGAALAALNLNIKELQSLDPAEALRRTAVALAGFADDGNKARLVQELFGKSVKDVAPFLKDLAEQGGLVAKVTAEQAQAAEDFNKQIFALQKNATDLGRALAGPLVSALNDTAAAFRKSAAEGKGFFESVGERYLANVRDFYELIGVSKPKRAKFIVDYSVDEESAAETARLVRKRSVDFEAGGKPTKTSPAKAKADIDNETSALDRYLQQLTNTLEKEQELTEVQRAQIRISEAGAQGFSEAKRQYVLDTAAQIDKERELKESVAASNAVQEDRIRLGRQRAIDEGVDNTSYQERLKGLLDDTASARLEKAREDVILLTQELEAGRLSEEKYLEAVAARAGITSEKIEKTKTLAEELGLTFTSAFEEAIVGGGKLSDVLKGLEKDILRIVIRKSVTEPLGNFLSGSLGKLLSFDGGGYTGNGARSGGLDGKGGFLSMVHPQESIIDHTKGGSGGNTIIINQTVGDVATVSMLQRNNQSLVRQIQSGLSRSQNYNGALA